MCRDLYEQERAFPKSFGRGERGTAPEGAEYSGEARRVRILRRCESTIEMLQTILLRPLWQDYVGAYHLQ